MSADTSGAAVSILEEQDVREDLQTVTLPLLKGAGGSVHKFTRPGVRFTSGGLSTSQDLYD